MIETQHLKVLLWKIATLRKRHWLITMLEIFVPISIFWFTINYKNLKPEEHLDIVTDEKPIEYTRAVYPAAYKLAFTPETNFTSELMRRAVSKLSGLGCEVLLQPFESETVMVHWLWSEYIKNVYDESLVEIGVIFSALENFGNLNYTIRTTSLNVETAEWTTYGQYNGLGNNSYFYSGFTTIQIVIDQAYLLLVHNIQVPKSFFYWLPMIVNMRAIDLMETLFPLLICLGFTFILPSLIREIVDEKSSGIKEMMHIMGLRNWMGWLSWAAYTLLIYIPVTFFISLLLTSDISSGRSVHCDVFTLWLLFLLFLFANIALIFTISTLFTNGSLAMIAGELIWVSVSVILEMVVLNDPDKYGFWLNAFSCLWPCTAIAWGIKSINSFYKNGSLWTWGSAFDDGARGSRISVGVALIMLSLDTLIYSFLTFYLEQVNPGPYGRPRPLTFLCRFFKEKKYNPDSSNDVETRPKTHFETAPSNLRAGIKIQNLQKTFKRGKVTAIKNIDLDIYERTITVLLGHNGAGKSTLMSIMSGFLLPSGGKIIVNGQNIIEDMKIFRSTLGLCPQHNLLFDVFTVIEHLILFGMLKGYTMLEAESEGMSLLSSFTMENKKDKLVANLSGGMRRKLCLAIALLGNPKVLLLDEPTSGLDPESRRKVWDVLLQSRRDRTVLITTHFMEEADVLGDRIAIMDHGEVSCYGTPLFLKKTFGKGYQLDISKSDGAKTIDISNLVAKYVSSAAIKRTSGSFLSYTVNDRDSAKFPILFRALDDERKNLGITAVGVACSSLEEVFLRVVGDEIKQEDFDEDLGLGITESKYRRETGCNNILLQFRGLFYIRYLRFRRSWITNLIFIATLLMLTVIFMLSIKRRDQSTVHNKLKLTLSTFPGARLAVASDEENLLIALENLAAARTKLEIIPPKSSINLCKYIKLKFEQLHDTTLRTIAATLRGLPSKNRPLKRSEVTAQTQFKYKTIKSYRVI